MYRIGIFILMVTSVLVESAPGQGEIEASGHVPSLFTFENGNVGVNFLGFRASAGLGGLLTGNAAHGGLHAEAGTPFGQSARAGLGGNVGGRGRSVGGLYADATAGGGVSAGAGLAGTAGSEEVYGTSYAGSSAGGVYKEKTRVKAVSPVSQVSHEGPTISDFEEKTIYVPSYVEKTVRVPTVIEQRVKVPARSHHFEKSVDAPPAEVNFETSKIKVVEHAPISTITHREIVHSRPFTNKHFFVGGNYGTGYGNEISGGSSSGGGISGTNTVTVRKQTNPQLFDDIFNIPISTLGVVNKLVNGIVGGTSGSVAVSKSAALY